LGGIGHEDGEGWIGEGWIGEGWQVAGFSLVILGEKPATLIVGGVTQGIVGFFAFSFQNGTPCT